MQPDDWLHDWVGASDLLRVDGRCRRCLERREGTAPVLFQARVRDDRVRLGLARRVGRDSAVTQRVVDEVMLGGHPDADDALEAAYDSPYAYLREVDTGRARFVMDEGSARRPPNLQCHRCGWSPRIARRDLWAAVMKVRYSSERVVYV